MLTEYLRQETTSLTIKTAYSYKVFDKSINFSMQKPMPLFELLFQTYLLVQLLQKVLLQKINGILI